MGKKSKSPRRQGRERAFQILYGCCFFSVKKEDYLRRTFNNFIPENNEKNSPANIFAWELINGVLENQDYLDQTIGQHSKNWRLNRIATVELTVLRLAAFEMLFRKDVPIKVSINEAIELSKKYGDNNSSRFVNGILDAIAKKCERIDDFSLAEPEKNKIDGDDLSEPGLSENILE